MPQRGRSSRTSEASHPIERVAQVIAAEPVEADFGIREDRWAQKLRRDIDSRLAAMRRQLVPARAAPGRVTRISAELRSLDRAALLSRLDTLQQAPGVRVAHLALSGLTTEDLRLLVAELEATARTDEVAK